MLNIFWALEQFFFWPARIVMGVAIFFKDLRLGIHYGYPLCCVTQFAVGHAIGVSRQGVRGGGVELTPTKVYVPCIYHRKKHPRWVPFYKQHRVTIAMDKRRMVNHIHGQQSLNNFYTSVKFSNPRLAVAMSDDIITVALHSLGADKSKGQDAANSLRERSRELPEVLRRVLESALTDLGYS